MPREPSKKRKIPLTRVIITMIFLWIIVVCKADSPVSLSDCLLTAFGLMIIWTCKVDNITEPTY